MYLGGAGGHSCTLELFSPPLNFQIHPPPCGYPAATNSLAPPLFDILRLPPLGKNPVYSPAYGTGICPYLEQIKKSNYLEKIRVFGSYANGGTYILLVVNPRRACAERVTVVVLCVCMSVTHTLFWQYARLKV